MQVDSISMDPRIAAIHFKDYRKKVREAKKKREEEAKKLITEGNKMRRSAYAQLSQIEKEDVIAMESYRALMTGARIINVATAIREAGRDNQELPGLAIAGATWKSCYLSLEHNRLCFTRSGCARKNYRSNAATFWAEPRDVVDFDQNILGAELTNGEWRKQNRHPSLGWPHPKAEVPVVPVHLRPDGALEQYHILFEAKWTKEAPPDPLLLRHIVGHMYSVIAQWDLTPLEKAVLEGRFG